MYEQSSKDKTGGKAGKLCSELLLQFRYMRELGNAGKVELSALKLQYNPVKPVAWLIAGMADIWLLLQFNINKDAGIAGRLARLL